MIIGQIIITVVIIKLWEQISKRAVFIPKEKIHGCLKWSDEIRENRDILFNKGNSYTKNLVLAATWMGFGLIVVFFLYVILPFLFSLNHFYNNRNAVIALISYLLFMFLNHQKNTIFHTKMNATKFDIIEDVSMLAGLCLSYYYSAVISDNPGSINFIVPTLVGFSLYPLFYNNQKISEAYYKNQKARINEQ